MAPKEYFPRVREAREALKARAIDLYLLQVKLIMDAAVDGNYKAALEANQWLMDHMPDEDGVRMIGKSQDAESPKQLDGKASGPTIQIGIQLGGVGGPKALPQAETTVIDVTPDKPLLNE